MDTRLLILEDNKDILEFIKRNFIFDGYSIESTIDGNTGIAIAKNIQPDLIVLNWMLPEFDGEKFCREVRQISSTPIIILTTTNTSDGSIYGIEVGADDYLVKPFSLEELVFSIRSQLRKTDNNMPKIYEFGGLSLDTSTKQAFRNKRSINLTAKEYELLELFMRHPMKILSRDVIYDDVWGYDFGGESNIIEVYVRYLRKKIDTKKEERLIHTVRGIGYILREPNSS
jgi:two-component system, OmpR family, response regulator MprA